MTKRKKNHFLGVNQNHTEPKTKLILDSSKGSLNHFFSANGLTEGIFYTRDFMSTLFQQNYFIDQNEQKKEYWAYDRLR